MKEVQAWCLLVPTHSQVIVLRCDDAAKTIEKNAEKVHSLTDLRTRVRYFAPTCSISPDPNLSAILGN